MSALKRKDAPVESTWGREAVYASWEDWQAEYDVTVAEMPDLGKYKGRLSEGPDLLAEWFEVYHKHWERVAILTGFARWAVTVDSNDQEARKHFSQSMGLESQLSATISFVDPELLEIGDTLLEWVQEENRLKVYKHYFDNLLRLRPHRRTAEVEEVLGYLEDAANPIFRTYSELVDTDLKFEDAVDSQGARYPIFQSTLRDSLESADRERRRTAWENYYDQYIEMQNTLTGIYGLKVREQNELAKARDFDSVLELRLSPNKLPVEVFHNLINVFKQNLPLWHRYWDVKRTILGVDKMHPYDIWAPILDEPPNIPYAQSIDWICRALQPLGDEYVDVMRRGSLEDRWVDWAPNVEKRQGAASSRKVGRKPPYIFMSYNDSVFSLSTLSHELGHSMHGYYFDTYGTYLYNEYGAISSTITETASNFNQAMTRAYLRQEKADDRNFQLAMIDEAMSNFHRYFFIMPTLARFELEVYEQAKAGKPMTANSLNALMSGLFAEGYGDTMTDDPARTGLTWATFLHLYIPFYSFQYAVGISAAHAMADRVLEGEEGAVAGYLEMLKAGGSRYAMDLFAMGGVDMSSPEPIEKAFAELETNVNMLEELAA
ncbi:MAG: oligoendopeptidase F family protein [Chloroflexi bacterium]|nr:oligoendopeptidase F family protein [Chloroflexota bacterium]